MIAIFLHRSCGYRDKCCDLSLSAFSGVLFYDTVNDLAKSNSLVVQLLQMIFLLHL